MKIEIKGVEFSNKGAELMLLSIVQVLDRELQEYDLVLTPGYLLPYQKRAKLGAWQKFSFSLFGIDWTGFGDLMPASVRKLMRHFGIVVEKDIDVVLDASGFVYSDKWGAHRLKETLKHLKRVNRHNNHYIFLPQAFGPFDQSQNAALMKQLLERAQWTIARDDESYQSLIKLCDEKQNNISCYPDFTPLFDPQSVWVPEQLPEHFVCIIPNNKMYANKTDLAKQQYLTFLSEAVAAIESLNLTPVILNHEGEKDSRLCHQLIDTLLTKPLFLDGLNGQVVKKVIGMSVFNLSSRFHGCVSSLSQGIPAISTSWGHKYEQLYRYYDCDNHVVGVQSTQIELQSLMAEIVAQRDVLSQQLIAKATEHKATINQMWDEVFRCIK